MVKESSNVNLHGILGQPTTTSRPKQAEQVSGSQEFNDVVRAQLNQEASKESNHDLRFSKHAQKRIAERNLDMDGDEFLKLRSAVDKLKNKGGKDSLVITSKGAYIVDVTNDTVVTAMSKEDIGENVFTKIDSTMFIN